MVVNARSLKRLKRRHTADLYDFLTFPSSSTDSFYDEGRICGPGPFRLNIKEFLTRHALLPPPSSLFPHLTTWQLLFRFGDPITAGGANDSGSDSFPVVVSLDVVEEDVARSRSVYCDQCRVVGWSEHPVCAKRYHFIVKADGRTSIGGFVKPCIKCGVEIHLSEPKCKGCNHVMTSVDVEDLVYNQLEDTSHLLHGVIHANGYGHLLRINGREGGSRALSGYQIMDFWDRLCKYLGVRKISVMDVSKKYGLEYRLLHGITKGHPWYGNWGYEFGAGSFALTQKSYKEAVDILSNLPLSIFICQGRKPRTHVQDLILYYQSLSEHELVNVRDLFCFIMSLIHNPEKMHPNSDEIYKKRGVAVPGVLCAWTSNDIKRVEEAMYRVLLAVSGSNWVSWRTLRGAVCKSGPLELLDYCLKELQGKQPADGKVVTARCNPESGAVEYRLERGNAVSLGNPTPACPPYTNYPSKEHLMRDLRYLYESLLHPHSMLSFGPEARRDLAVDAAARLLDCKQFVKDYRPETMIPFANPTVMFLLCQVELPDSEDEYATIPPPEMIPLPLTATIYDFKLEASKTFQEVYIIFKGFQGEELPDYGGVDESTLVRLLFRPFQTVSLSGKCPMRNGLARFKMERGIERWTVDCTCGAKDDDGERMLACDACGVWQHTRCAGIPDFDAVPAKFVCDRCKNLVKIAKITSHCKGEVMGGGGGSGGGKSLTALFGVR